MTEAAGMDEKKEIVEILQNISGKFPPTVIFDDWVKCVAISIQNACTGEADEIFMDRENQYRAVIDKYDAGIDDSFARMTAHLYNALLENIEDVLGIVYMEASMGNKNAGQFFTPTQISRIKARIIADQIERKNGKIYKLYEPTSGSGGIILETAKELQKKGIDYENCMYVVAQDLDWRCVYMTYVQLSLIGINAVVAQGNAIEDPFRPGKGYPMNRLFFTPKKMGVLDR